ncbi:WIN2, partial [Symbiodinium pilosum]
ASRSRSRRKRSRSRARKENRSRSKNRRSKSRDRRRPSSDESASPRKRTPSPKRRAAASRSKSRRATRKQQRSKTPERVPPTSFADYEPAPDGSGWYVYKKMSKWKFHPETGLYLHIKSGVYYIQKEGDPKNFRKIDDDDDPIVRKMKQSEEMRRAIQSTEFVHFGEGAAAAAPRAIREDGVPAPVEIAPAPKPPEKEKPPEESDKKIEGKVREWNAEKGFGFIIPLVREDEEAPKSIFVHLWNVVGSTSKNPINLREGAKVLYKLGEQDGKPRAQDVVMLGKDGQPLPVHAGAQNLEEKRKSYFVTAETLRVRVHGESWPGKQIELQDRFAQDEAMDELGVYFGVFDGHGGAQVSEIAAKTLHRNILACFRQKAVQPASRDEKIKLAVREAFAQTDRDILALSERKKFDSSGATAVCAMLHGNPKLGTALRLVLAHIGDSRAILCRAGTAVQITEDHKPDRIDEKKRIERAGGLVLNVRGAWRIAAPAKRGASKSSRREYQGLSITRSLGDACFKNPALSSADPEVRVLPISDKDLFIVLVTEGVTRVLSNQDVIDCASKHWDDSEEAAKNIVRTAFQAGSDENLTALVIQFGWADKHTPRYIERRKQMVAQGVDGGSPVMKPTAEPSKEVFNDKAVEKDDFDMFG